MSTESAAAPPGIWTRLAPDPFAPLGGMNGVRTVLGWEMAHDEAFSRVVRQGRYTCGPELGYSAHVDVQGLESDRRIPRGAGPPPLGRRRRRGSRLAGGGGHG